MADEDRTVARPPRRDIEELIAEAKQLVTEKTHPLLGEKAELINPKRSSLTSHGLLAKDFEENGEEKFYFICLRGKCGAANGGGGVKCLIDRFVIISVPLWRLVLICVQSVV